MRAALRLFVMLALASWPGFAATLSVSVDPPQASVGEPVTLAVSVQGGTIDIVALPAVDGVQVLPGVSTVTYAFTSGTLITTMTRKYQLVAARPGDFTLPAFDVTLKEGTVLRSRAVKFHVLDGSAASTGTTPAPDHHAGPVVLPPVNDVLNANQPPPSDASPNAVSPPRDPGGGPAKVFMIITPQTTDAYAGELVPLRIDFYIQSEANADQDSLPTIKGSDFLMNDFSVRGHESLTVLEGVPYECDTWLTAIAAPKSGDFPLASERDTYWVKSITASGLDPFGFTRHTNLAHEVITSNQLTMHIHPLPAEGRPDNFTGAVGQFAVSSAAQPATIAMGEPVTLTFAIRGSGNFDYVRCPALAPDPHWKTYAPTSTIVYDDEQRTQGSKTFVQLVLPLENGNVPLPPASFSYFDTRLKQYTTVLIHLPSIAVTGAMPVAPAAPASVSPAATASAAEPADVFLPNRAELGELTTSMLPVYRQPWFWILQGALLALPFCGLLVFALRRWRLAGRESNESASRRRSLRHEEHAMAEAVRRNDARAFFTAARHAVQLQLGARWGMTPEAITTGEIRRRDPALAETLAPLFAQADEIIYSGRASANVDLAHWARVAHECLQLQPA